MCPNTDHSPSVEQHNAHHYSAEHGLRAELEALLDCPEAKDTGTLGGDADNEEIREFEGVVGNDAVLQCRNDGYSGVQSVGEYEEAW